MLQQLQSEQIPEKLVKQWFLAHSYPTGKRLNQQHKAPHTGSRSSAAYNDSILLGFLNTTIERISCKTLHLFSVLLYFRRRKNVDSISEQCSRHCLFIREQLTLSCLEFCTILAQSQVNLSFASPSPLQLDVWFSNCWRSIWPVASGWFLHTFMACFDHHHC